MARMSVEDRRTALVEAALTVMARDGVAAATTRSICAEAGMPQSVFHYAFRSKDELVRLAAKSMLETTLPIPGPRAQVQSLREILDGAIDMFWAATVADPQRQAVVYELTLMDRRGDDDPGALGRWQYEIYRRRAGELLAYAAAETGARWTVETDRLAALVAAAVDGIVLAWLATGDDDGAQSSLAALADAVEALAELPETVSDRSTPVDASGRRR